MTLFTINTNTGQRKIGESAPTFIVAEMSGNHLHSFERAQRLIKAAAECGVDAIKLQTYTADTLTINCDNDYFQVKVNDAWSGKTLYQLYQEAYTPWEWQPKLKAYAESLGLFFFSTPFDATAVDFLESLDVQLYKVASFSTLNIPLLEKIGSTHKPVIISRGLTSLPDLELAIDTLRNSGAPAIAILHCVSSYPAEIDQMNLLTIPDLIKRFSTVVGLSDHTLSQAVPVASVALGGSIIEKHLTLSRKEGGPDAQFSLNPTEMKELVRLVRDTERSLGHPNYDAEPEEKKNLVFQQSIFVIKDIEKGELLTTDNVRIIRPGYGLSPRYYKEILGKRALTALPRGTPLTRTQIEN